MIDHEGYTVVVGGPSPTQEAHGPHRSREKTLQINKHIQLYHNID